MDTIIPEEGSLSPRLQAAIANFEARTSGLLLPSGIGESITAAVEGATAIGETVGRFVQEIDEIDDAETPHLGYHALSLIDKPERGEGTLRKRDLDGLLKAAGIEPGHNRTYLATFLYFHGYFNQDVATTKRHLALLPNSEARHYIREAIFNTTARLKRDEDIEAQAFISLTTEDNYDPFARDVPWAAKQAKKIFGNTRMPEDSDRFEELLAEEAGEPVGDSSTLTSSGELRTVSKRRFCEEDAGVLLGGDLDGEEKDEPVRAELERKFGVKYLNRRKGEGKKRGRSLETSSLDPRQARTYWILKYMVQRGTKRDKTFVALILQGYTPEDLSKMYDPNQTQNCKRKVGRWPDDKKQLLLRLPIFGRVSGLYIRGGKIIPTSKLYTREWRISVDLEVILAYNAGQMGSAPSVPLGKTDNPHILRAVGEALLWEANYRKSLWTDADPVLGEMMDGDTVRLQRNLTSLMPEDETEDEAEEDEKESSPISPDLRLLAGGAVDREALQPS